MLPILAKTSVDVENALAAPPDGNASLEGRMRVHDVVPFVFVPRTMQTDSQSS